MIGHTLKNYSYSILPHPIYISQENRLRRLTRRFANLTNFIALLGGQIKSKQVLSGYMADILSSIYLSYSTIYYFQEKEKFDFILNYLLKKLCAEGEKSINKVIQNYPIPGLKQLLIPTMYINIPEIPWKEEQEVYNYIIKNHEIRKLLQKDLFLEGTVLEKLEKLNHLDKNSKEYQELYQEVIQVGEYPNE